MLGVAPGKHTPPTSLGSQICSKEKKQKKKQKGSEPSHPAQELRCCHQESLGRSGCRAAPIAGVESAPLWLEWVASHLCLKDSCKIAS